MREEVFPGRPSFSFSGTLQLFNSIHVRERDKGLLRIVLVRCVWNGFLLRKVKGQRVFCRFCGGDDNDGHLFWDCTLWLRFMKILSFMISWRWISLVGHGVCCGMGGCRCFLGLVVVPLVQGSPLRVQVLLVLILLISFLFDNCRLDLML